MAAVKRVVSTVTNVIFPEAKEIQQKPDREILSGGQYMSNLPLQMAIYFNLFFFPLWLITEIILIELKFSELSQLYKIISISIVVILTPLEITRLYLGFSGNLSERVPELAGFWLITLVLTIPLFLFLLFNDAIIIVPMERAMNAIYVAFVLFEVISGFIAIRMLVKYQATKFHLSHFVDLEPIPADEYDEQMMNESKKML
ncbi:DgyrCDS13175 [Dimorphilus gyrociliatus]|uniref:DgyrCDS13175 n=1 Tax=Dimorphilus gyrociliatus TaxID=2664684 RepID=A0A7I8W9W4_9ANNE|nr:DgyrCDS13175 [Dimorphilus gyrociliatus]